ncbi:MAG: cation transporter [Firmicutes bacterium]|nr:cation transporter [Bacillota bacterium]
MEKDNNVSVASSNDYATEATRVEIIGIVTNLALFVFKLIAGILGKSGAMISDAIHTASDVFADLIAILGLQMSKKEEDSSHPYGHEKIECLFTLVLGVVLLTVGISVGYSAVTGIIDYLSGNAGAIAQPGIIAIVAALVSIGSKEALFQYVIQRSKKLNSPTLKATAWHHRSDSLSSIGALIGIVGARFGITILDSVASLIICIIVVKIGIEVLVASINNLIDASADKEFVKKANEICVGFPGVEELITLKTRQFGHKIYVEATIGCRNDMTLEEGHDVAENLHDKLEAELNNVKHAFIHVDPVEKKK